MKKYLIFEATACAHMQTNTYGVVVNTLNDGLNVPSRFEDWGEAMNRDTNCPWYVVTYNKMTHLWDCPPPQHHPFGRGPPKLVVEMPTDYEIKNLRSVLNAFRDQHGEFSQDILNKHVTAFQELMLVQTELNNLCYKS